MARVASTNASVGMEQGNIFFLNTNLLNYFFKTQHEHQVIVQLTVLKGRRQIFQLDGTFNKLHHIPDLKKQDVTRQPVDATVHPDGPEYFATRLAKLERTDKIVWKSAVARTTPHAIISQVRIPNALYQCFSISRSRQPTSSIILVVANAKRLRTASLNDKSSYQFFLTICHKLHYLY